MPFADLDAQLLDVFGSAGTYTPTGGSAISTHILVEEQVDAFGGSDFGSRYQESLKTAFVLAAVATSPQRGDTLKIGAIDYQVDEVLRDDSLLVQLSVRIV